MQFRIPQICYQLCYAILVQILLLLPPAAALPAYDIPEEYRPARKGPNYHYENLAPTAYGLCSIMDWKCSGYPFGIIANDQGECPYHNRTAFGLDKKGCCSSRNAPCWNFAATRVNANNWKTPTRPPPRETQPPWNSYVAAQLYAMAPGLAPGEDPNAPTD